MASKASAEQKSKLLGEPLGTAANRLRRDIMFQLVRQCGLDTCYRCGKRIENALVCSIEHKQEWQRAADPVRVFFDLDNIAFSHRKCNVRTGEWGAKRKLEYQRVWRARKKTLEAGWSSS